MEDKDNKTQALEAQESTRGTIGAATEQPKRKATPAQAAAGKANLLKFTLRHGVKATITSGGAIPESVPGGAEISAAAEEIIQQTVLDLGYETEQAMPAQKRSLLCAQRLCLKILMLSDAYIGAEGVVIKGRANPLLTVAATYINSLRLTADKLGLERVSKNVTQTFEQVISEYRDARAAEPHQKAPGDGGSQEGGGRENEVDSAH